MGFEEKKELLKKKRSPLLGVVRQRSGSISSGDDRSREKEHPEEKNIEEKVKEESGGIWIQNSGSF